MENENQSLPAAAHDPARLAEEVYGKMETPFNESAGSHEADSDRALIAQAIAAERERCAKVVEADEYNCMTDDPTLWSEMVAAKIRSGE